MTERCLLIFRWLFFFLRVYITGRMCVCLGISARCPICCSTGFNSKDHILRRSILSLIFLLILMIRLYCSSFRGNSSCHASFVQRFFLCVSYSGSYMMIMDMLLLCWPQDDQAVFIMMIVSLIRLVLSAVAIISPHLFLPILNYSCYLHYLCYWTVLPLHIHLLLFSVSLNDHFCVVLITWSFLVRHLTNGEVWKSFLLPKYVSCLLKAYQDVRTIYC